MLYGLAIIPIFAPVHFHYGVFGSEDSSEDYLTTLWQVVGAALGLSLAMIGFLFQAFIAPENRTLGGSFREFTERTGLQMTLWVGFATLVGTGLVLLEIGTDAPNGWSALWVVVLAGITLAAALPYVFHQVIRSLDFEYLLEHRAGQLASLVDSVTRSQVLAQVGDSHLRRTQETTGITRELWVESGAGLVIVSASRDGVVRDVRLWVLRLLRSAPDSVLVLVSLEDAVKPGHSLVALPAGTSLWKARVARLAVKVGRTKDGDRLGDKINEQLDRLHDGAMAAIKDGRRADWEHVSRVYRDVLLAMPRAARAVNVRFEGEVARPIFRSTPLGRLERALYAEMKAAIDSGDEELLLLVLWFPHAVAIDAARLSAQGLVAAMLRLYPMIYREAER